MTKKNLTLAKEEEEEEEEEEKKSIKRLRELVEQEKFLKVRTDDNFLLRYLNAFQGNPEFVFRKMQTYYSLKHQHPDWYITEENVASFESELSNHLYYILKDRDRYGKRIYVNRLGMIDTSRTTMHKQSQIQDLFLECVLDEEETQKNGLSVIVDLKNFSWTLLKWLTPTNICIAVKKIEALPFKKIEFHVVNTSALINAAVKIIWPFLSAKTKENIHFHHDDWSSLHKIIDPQVLPSCYGGTEPDFHIDNLLKIIPGSVDRLSGNLRLGYIQNPDT